VPPGGVSSQCPKKREPLLPQGERGSRFVLPEESGQRPGRPTPRRTPSPYIFWNPSNAPRFRPRPKIEFSRGSTRFETTRLVTVLATLLAIKADTGLCTLCFESEAPSPSHLAGHHEPIEWVAVSETAVVRAKRAASAGVWCWSIIRSSIGFGMFLSAALRLVKEKTGAKQNKVSRARLTHKSQLLARVTILRVTQPYSSQHFAEHLLLRLGVRGVHDLEVEEGGPAQN
jgi:hypothetical protein